MVLVALNSTGLHAQDGVHPYRTKQSIASTTALRSTLPRASASLPWVDCIEDWSRAYSISIWLDRRIPTDRLIGSIEGGSSVETLGEALEGIAQAAGAELAHMDGLVLIVPSGRATVLETLHWELYTELARSSPGDRRILAEAQGMEWEEGAVAASLLESYCARYEIAGLEPHAIEHDLWRAYRFKHVSPLASGFGLLSGFDLCLVPGTTGWRVGDLLKAKVADRVSWDYGEEIPRIGRNAWREWRERWPGVQVEKLGQGGTARWKITGPVRAHRELVAPLAPAPATTAPDTPDTGRPAAGDPSRSRFTGRYRGELQAVLRSLSQQLRLEWEPLSLPESIARQELDLQFDHASLDEILAEIARASSVVLRREGNRLILEWP